jgi:hypothetical protein
MGARNDLGKSIRKTLSFDRTATVGVGLLATSSLLGALLRNSAYITNVPAGHFNAVCDTYLKGFCVPTGYLSIPLGPIGSLVINLTSFAVSATLFVLGILLVRK